MTDRDQARDGTPELLTPELREAVERAPAWPLWGTVVAALLLAAAVAAWVTWLE